MKTRPDEMRQLGRGVQGGVARAESICHIAQFLLVYITNKYKLLVTRVTNPGLVRVCICNQHLLTFFE